MHKFKLWQTDPILLVHLQHKISSIKSTMENVLILRLFGTSKYAYALQQDVQFIARPCLDVSGAAPVKVLQLQTQS